MPITHIPIDCIEVVAQFAAPAVLARLLCLNRATFERLAPLLYRFIKVVHLESDGFGERARDDKELPIQNLPAVARRHGLHIQELVYYADTPFDAGDIQRELVHTAVDIFCASIPLLTSLKAFRWHSQAFPDNPRLWALLQGHGLLCFDMWLYGHLGQFAGDRAFSDLRLFNFAGLQSLTVRGYSFLSEGGSYDLTLGDAIIACLHANEGLRRIKLHFEAIQGDDWGALLAGPFVRAWPQLTSLHLDAIGPLRCPSLSEILSSFLEAHSCLANLHLGLCCDALDSSVFQRLTPGSLPHLNRLALQSVALLDALAFFGTRAQLLDVRLLSTWTRSAGDNDDDPRFEQSTVGDEQLPELVRLLGFQTQLQSLSLFFVLDTTTLPLIAPIASTCPMIKSLRLESIMVNGAGESTAGNALLLRSVVNLLSKFSEVENVLLPRQELTGVAEDYELNTQGPYPIPLDQFPAAEQVFDACARLRNLHWADSSPPEYSYWWIRRDGRLRYIDFRTDYEELVWPQYGILFHGTRLTCAARATREQTPLDRESDLRKRIWNSI